MRLVASLKLFRLTLILKSAGQTVLAAVQSPQMVYQKSPMCAIPALETQSHDLEAFFHTREAIIYLFLNRVAVLRLAGTGHRVLGAVAELIFLGLQCREYARRTISRRKDPVSRIRPACRESPKGLPAGPIPERVKFRRQRRPGRSGGCPPGKSTPHQQRHEQSTHIVERDDRNNHYGDNEEDAPIRVRYRVGSGCGCRLCRTIRPAVRTVKSAVDDVGPAAIVGIKDDVA